MNNEKLNCCDTDNPGCSTPETNCCSTGGKFTDGNNKKKIGLGVLLLAMAFAVVSAFTMNTSNEKSSCNSDQESCATSCSTGNTGSSCCSKK